MLKNIFLPEKISSYYLFPKRIIGFTISKTHVTACKVYAYKTTLTIEKCFDEKIDTSQPINESVPKALKTILQKAGNYDTITTSITSSHVIFKELKLPFLEHERIKKVLPYELEPLLPFSLDQATFDFIITKKNSEEKSAEILIAAVQDQTIENHLELFNAINISPNIVTVDLFGLYGLYTQIPEYANLAGGVTLIDLEMQQTRITYIQDGQLRFIRTLTNGTHQSIKAMSDALKRPLAAVTEDILRFGFEKNDDPDFIAHMQTEFKKFWEKINFTIQSFSMRATTPEKPTMLLVLGAGAEIKGLPSFVSDILHIPTQRFSLEKLLENKLIRTKPNLAISSSMIISLGTALPAHITHDFNLQKKHVSTYATRLLNRQIIVAGLLFALFLSLIGIHYFWQIHVLQSELNDARKESIAVLREKFPEIEGASLDDAIEAAEEKLAEDERIYAQTPFLKYLLELTSVIDAKSLGFSIDKLTISKDTIQLDAQVKDYEALKLLERDLKKSKLFSYIEPQETTKFNMELKIAKESEEA